MKPTDSVMVYLSGPMTGYPDWNFAEFERYAKAIREIPQFFVWSPHELFSGDTTRRRDEYIREDLSAIMRLDRRTDRIAMLPGWQDSAGAKLELLVALEMELDRFEIQISGSGTVCWRNLPDDELPFTSARRQRVYVTRRPGGQHLMTECPPVITERAGTQVRDAWGVPGDNIDHQICPTIAGKLFGRQFQLLKPEEAWIAGG